MEEERRHERQVERQRQAERLHERQVERHRQAERRLTSKLAGEELGRKMKKVLLLTAAFGAVHTALQHDILAGACTVL